MTKKETRPTLYVCTNQRAGGAFCMAGGSTVYRALYKRAKARGDKVLVMDSMCMGYCDSGPNVKIYGGAFFHGVKPEDADKIIDAAEALDD